MEQLEEVRSFWIASDGHRDSALEFYLTVLRSSPETVRPHVIVIYRDDKPDALFVGRLDRASVDFRVGYWHVKAPATVLYFVYSALRGNATPENCELFVTEICRSLSQQEADLAYLNLLRLDSHLYRFAISLPGALSRDRIRVGQPHFAARLPSSADEFYRNLSSNTRWQLKSKQKKLFTEFAGKVEIRSFRRPHELGEMIKDVEKVARTSYQRGLGVGFADNLAIRERLQYMAEKGWLRGYLLYIGLQPAAFWIGDVIGDRFGSDYLGFDPQFEKHSPGMYLMSRVIEELCASGVTEVDFAPGYAQYKKALGNQEWQECPVYIFAPTLKGIQLNLRRTLMGGISHGAKWTLERTRLLQRIKKKWRSHVRSG